MYHSRLARGGQEQDQVALLGGLADHHQRQQADGAGQEDEGARHRHQRDGHGGELPLPGADLLGLSPRDLGPGDPQRPQDLPGEDGELMQRRIPKGRMGESIRSTHRNAVSSRSR